MNSHSKHYMPRREHSNLRHKEHQSSYIDDSAENPYQIQTRMLEGGCIDQHQAYLQDSVTVLDHQNENSQMPLRGSIATDSSI